MQEGFPGTDRSEIQFRFEFSICATGRNPNPNRGHLLWPVHIVLRYSKQGFQGGGKINGRQ